MEEHNPHDATDTADATADAPVDAPVQAVTTGEITQDDANLAMLAHLLGSIVFSILGALKAKDKQPYRYPVALRLVK